MQQRLFEWVRIILRMFSPLLIKSRGPDCKLVIDEDIYWNCYTLLDFFITLFGILIIHRMASSSLQTMMKEGEHRKWADLPPELTSLILQHLDAVEIVEKAKKVCRSWRSVCKDPSMWRKIEMRSLDPWKHKYHEKICRHAVDRSQGGLVAIHLWNFCTNSLLSYIAHRFSLALPLYVFFCVLLLGLRLSLAMK